MKGYSMDRFGNVFARHGRLMIGMMILSIVAVVVAVVVAIFHGALWGIATFFAIDIIGGAIIGIYMMANIIGGGKKLFDSMSDGRPLSPPTFVDTRHRL